MSENNNYPEMNFDPFTGERIKKETTAEVSTEQKPEAEEEREAVSAVQDQVTEIQEARKPQETEEQVTPMQARKPQEVQEEVTPMQAQMPQEMREQVARAQAWEETPVQKLQEEEPVKARKAKKERKTKQGGGFFKKAFAAVVLAAVFGGVAGGTFYGICKYTGVLDKTGITAQSGAVLPEGQNLNLTELPVKQATEKADKEIKLVNSDNIQVVSTDISNMVEEVIPAMVTIVNTGKEEYDFWGRSYSSQSSGTGVIIGENEKELLIVTNHHVAKDAKQLDITFIDDVKVQAKVKGMDSDMDLAVLSVALEDIPQETKEKIVVAQLGDSDSLKLGQPAVVIGNALGIGISVTDGIISGLNREMTTEDGKKGTFIQTDAAVNHGNSGGALLNIKGEVIGIVSNKIDGESVEGMGYAIPISAASPIIKELIERQTRTDVVDEKDQGYLGVSLQNVTSEARAYYGLPEGAYVYAVVEGSGAEKAGIQKGDVITKIEKIKVTSGTEAREILQYYRIGETVTVSYSRLEGGDYVSHEVQVTLGSSGK